MALKRVNITNTDVVVANADLILEKTIDIRNTKASVDYILDELNEYWAANPDEQKLETHLDEYSTLLGSIIECNNEFANAVKKYITSEVKISEELS